MADVRVVTASNLDYAMFSRLQQEAFAEIAAQSGTPMTQTEKYYRWKYRTPVGEAKVALVHQDGEVVAANSMYPLRVNHAGGSTVVWQSCDTATVPKARGKGYFKACLGALKEQLGPETIFFGFPNSNSRPGFAKFGWTLHGHVDAAVRVWPGFGRTERPGLEKLERFDHRQDELASRWNAANGPTLDRSADYMNWRYFDHPAHRYTALASTGRGRVEGVVVLRQGTIRRRKATIIMDLVAERPGVVGRLLRTAAAWGRKNGTLKVVMMNNTVGLGRALANLYVRVPRRAMATEHVLMGAGTSDSATALLGSGWRVQLGDGDGF